MKQLDDLPEEMLLLIFRYVTTSDLLTNVRWVCTKWNRLANDYQLYDSILIDNRMKWKTAADVFRKHGKRITHLVFRYRNDLNHLLPFVVGLSDLLSLKIIECHGQVRNITNLSNAVNVKLLGRVLRSCSAINTLQIQNTIFLNGLHNFCPQNSKLHTIRVKSNKYLEITDRKLEIITGLQDLQLQGVKLYNDRGLIRVFLNNEQTLTVLKLDIWKNPFDESREDELMQFIGRCTHLTKLSLQNYSTSGLTDQGFAYLSNLKRLKSLVVTSAKKVSARAIMRLFYEPHVQQFEKIDLGRCPGLHQLVLKFIVDRCPNLRELCLDQFGLDCSCIGVVDLQYIGEHSTRLRHLELSSMGNAVSEALPFILKKYPNLRSFKYVVRPIKDYFSEYDVVFRKIEQELPGFEISCSLKQGIRGYRR